MRKVMKYPIYPITFSYVNGIFFANSFAGGLSTLSILTALCILFLVTVFFVSKYSKLYSSLQRVLIVLLIISSFGFGYIQYIFTSQVPKPYPSEIGKLVIKEKLKANDYAFRFYADYYVENNKIGKVLLYQTKEDSIYKVGDVLMDRFEFTNVPKAYGPNLFDYSAYLSSKQIFYQTFTSKQTSRLGTYRDFNYYLQKFRQYLLDSYSSYYPNSNDQAMVAGLLFGQKQDLSSELEAAYRNTGVMHILAVSGMHVMLIYFTLKSLLSFLRIGKKGQFFIIITLLVLFAFLSGLSGSVIRAVLMCVIFLIGSLLKKDNFTTYSLVLSMQLILWFYPNFLFDIGFQLSYLAVFSIVFIYPLIKSIFSFKHYILKYIAETLGITIAAQLGVSFLSMYYFNQFPIWFILSNFIAIPTTSLALIGLLVQMPFNFLLPIVSKYIAIIISTILSFCNHFLLQIDSFQIKTINEVYLTKEGMVLMTCIVFLLVGFVRFKRFSCVFATLVCLMLFYSFKLKDLMSRDVNGWYIVGNRDHLEVVHYNNHSMRIFYRENVSNYTSGIRAKMPILYIDSIAFKHTIIDSKTFYVLDSLNVIHIPYKVDYLIVKDNSNVNMERVFKENEIKYVVLHASNTNNYRKEWKEYLLKKNIPFHDMREKGYVRIPN